MMVSEVLPPNPYPIVDVPMLKLPNESIRMRSTDAVLNPSALVVGWNMPLTVNAAVDPDTANAFELRTLVLGLKLKKLREYKG